jgi:hypothetical protein
MGIAPPDGAAELGAVLFLGSADRHEANITRRERNRRHVAIRGGAEKVEAAGQQLCLDERRRAETLA